MKFYWQMMEAALKPAPYLLGSSATALDIYVAMMVHWTPGKKWFAEHCPKIMNAVALTEKHEVVAKIWERNFV